MSPSLRSLSRGLLLLGSAPIAGCQGPQSMFNAAGPAAYTIASLSWFVLILFGTVAIVTMALIIAAALRHRGTLLEHAAPHIDGGKRWIVFGGVLVPVVVLSTVFITGLIVMGSFPSPSHAAEEEVRVIGHQWWWELEYRFGGRSQWVPTANEIHVPVRHTVQLELVTSDVIHSFWVPRLHGKVDLVPGMNNAIRIRADRRGVYLGTCAEFCGAQHANMQLAVIADEPAEFAHWLRAQRADAVAPVTPAAQRGYQVFMNGPCVVCHAIRGTTAHGSVGPDLTHLASRRTIAAGTLPNTRANLQAWVTNAQSLKPGSRMPSFTQFTGRELNDLVTYLQTLR